MKTLLLFLVWSLSHYTAFSQVDEYANIDSLAIQIPESSAHTTKDISDFINTHFNTDSEKLRATFVWVASTFNYDVEHMTTPKPYKKGEDRISRILKSKKGVCENYAALFTEICNKVGLPSYVIVGYTKQNGLIDSIPHAWCAAQLDSVWYLFDPTWGSGYIMNKIFFKRLNNAYYKVLPEVMLTSHMPFDPLWQFVHYPISHQSFYEDHFQQDTTNVFFSYQDSLSMYQQQSRLEQLNGAARRIEENGIYNAMMADQLKYIYAEMEQIKQQELASIFNGVVADFNETVKDFNRFIVFRNKQFRPEKTDLEIQEMIDLPAEKLSSLEERLSAIQEPDSMLQRSMASLRKNMSSLKAGLQQQQTFLSTYLSKNKADRRAMFVKNIKVKVPIKNKAVKK